MTTSWSPREEEGLVNHVIKRVVARSSGALFQECFQNQPRDVYFLGNLRSRKEIANIHGALPSELLNKLAPVAIAAEIQVAAVGRSSTARITVQWACYYRVFPTFAQQRRHQEAGIHVQPDAASADATREAPEDNEAPKKGDKAARQRQRKEASVALRDNLALRYKKISASASADISLADVMSSPSTIDTSPLEAAIDSEIKRCQAVVSNDREVLRVPKRDSKSFPVPANAIATKEAFAAWQATFTQPAIPGWEISVNGMSWAGDTDAPNSRIVCVEVVNDSGPVDDAFVESYLFEVGLSIELVSCQLVPFRVELAPKGFRFDPFIPGRGHNCELRAVAPNHLETSHTPIYQQSRYVTRSTPTARFSDLAKDPLPVLEALSDAMSAYTSEWDAAFDKFVQIPGWTEKHETEFCKDRQIYADELKRFREGVRLIATDPDVRLAFQLTNQTFFNLGQHPQPSKSKDSWRLFQIVFLLSQIAGIHALKVPSKEGSREREMVDVIYFPTGGGKTEAYLSTIVFHCFFDRLRGKAAGVTCWTRFPLRLLTLQQTQRMADAIGTADLIRSSHPDKRLANSDRFAVGYLVGAEATPNELEPPRSGQFPNENWSQANDPNARQRWKRIASCPNCKTNSISVDFDPQRIRLIHRCTNRQCRFPQGELPVFVTDNEVFRYLPSVVVGTVDKLAGLGNQRKFALLLGQVDGRCREHGYYKAVCCQKGCADPTLLQPGLPGGLTGPTLIVQDELHLLKEGLGTFDSHYESFLQAVLCVTETTPRLKIIGSSATIEQFERQIEHLYGKTRSKARIFPGKGPTLASSFYAETLDHAQRVYVGLLPHNKTLFNAVLELTESYHREVIELRKLTSGPSPWGGALAPGSSKWNDLVDCYWTSLTYFLAGRELHSIHTDIEGDTNPRLQADGLPPLSISQLTGETSTDEVTATLALLENNSAPTDPPRTVLATSMVSHGVDIDRLNAMLFYGMPRLTAEYIQASSRVGRSHVGLVFVCLHPARERDQSHYAYFRKYHEFLGQLVEPVAINRWATYSIDRTISGLFMAVLLQRIAHRPGMTKPNQVYFLNFLKKEISSGSIKADDFVPLLEASYLVEGDTGGPGRQSFAPRIPQRVRQFLDHILQTSGTDQWVSEALIPSPMRSLRDVDEAITIELDSEGTDWAQMQ